MNLNVLNQNKFFYFLNNIKSENLGLYFSFFLHLFILLIAIGIPNFFDPKPIIIPSIIPIEIINVTEVTSLQKETKELKNYEKKKINIKEKKFNSSDNLEIKKIEIKEKPEIKNNELEKKIIPKENKDIQEKSQTPNELEKKIIPKEKKDIQEKSQTPNELKKKKLVLDTNEYESLPSKKIKPKIKPVFDDNKSVEISKTTVKINPKPKFEKVVNSDININVKPKKKPEPEFSIASMLKDLRNEKTIPNKNNKDEDKETEEDIVNKPIEKPLKDDVALSISEIDLVLQQLSRCFIAPAGAEIDKSMFVKISAKIQKNRRVLEHSIQIVDTNISKSSSFYGPITESAMRTLLNPECIPLKLPEKKYEVWKNLTMKFDYSVMRGG